MPSQTTSTAPRIHPSIACGPCIVATIKRDRDERPDADHVDHVQRGGLREADAARRDGGFAVVMSGIAEIYISGAIRV